MLVTFGIYMQWTIFMGQILWRSWGYENAPLPSKRNDKIVLLYSYCCEITRMSCRLELVISIDRSPINNRPSKTSLYIERLSTPLSQQANLGALVHPFTRTSHRQVYEVRERRGRGVHSVIYALAFNRFPHLLTLIGWANLGANAWTTEACLPKPSPSFLLRLPP